MGTCSAASAIQLSGTVFLFLFAVLWLDMYWVKVKAKPHLDDIGGMLKRQNWLNAFVALGAVSAAALTLVWVNSCSGSGV